MERLINRLGDTLRAEKLDGHLYPLIDSARTVGLGALANGSRSGNKMHSSSAVVLPVYKETSPTTFRPKTREGLYRHPFGADLPRIGGGSSLFDATARFDHIPGVALSHPSKHNVWLETLFWPNCSKNADRIVQIRTGADRSFGKIMSCIQHRPGRDGRARTDPRSRAGSSYQEAFCFQRFICFGYGPRCDPEIFGQLAD